MRRQHTVRLLQARGQELEIIIEDIVVRLSAKLNGLISPPAETRPIAICRLASLDTRASLCPPGVKGGSM